MSLDDSYYADCIMVFLMFFATTLLGSRYVKCGNRLVSIYLAKSVVFGLGTSLSVFVTTKKPTLGYFLYKDGLSRANY